MKRNWSDNKLKMMHDGWRTLRLRAVRRCWWSLWVIVLLALNGCGNGEEASHDPYTCPMHPTVVSDRPGSCPVCGMELVRKSRTGGDIRITEDLSRLLKSSNEVVMASVRTIKPEFRSARAALEATGVVAYDTRNLYSIAARVGGRLEKVYVKYAFQRVYRGQKVAEIYSPELLAAQRELLFLLENDSGNESLIQASRSKLEQLGLTAAQIGRVVSGREPQNTFAIYSPHSGYVVAQDASPSAPSGMPPSAGSGGGMDSPGGNRPASSSVQPSSGSTTGEAPALVREGTYVAAGETLFNIVNTSALRIELDLPGAAAGAVSRGDSVTLATADARTHIATVDFVQPYFSEGENFIKIRVYTRETDGLQIGQLIRATITAPQKESLWVPRKAVLDLGTREVVFIKDKEVFRPKTVTIGIRSGDFVEIKSGLASSEEIAGDPHYLVDSESFIKPAN